MTEPSRRIPGERDSAPSSAERLLGRLGDVTMRLAELSEVGDHDAMLDAATREVAALLGERGSCVLLAPHPHLRVAMDAPREVGRRIELERYPEIERALRTRRVAAIEDTRTDELLDAVRHTLPADLGAVAAVPLVARGRAHGVLVARSRAARRMGEAALHAAQAIGRLAASLAGLGAEPSPPPPARADAGTDLDAADERGRVLIVEDDVAQAEALTALLRARGHRAEWTASGHEALRLARERAPDLVLLDVHLPDRSGYELSKELRSMPGAEDCAVILVSAADDLVTRVRAEQLGESDFLTKPYDVQELLTRIEKATGELRSRRRWREQAFTDELTGLGNLRLLRERLASESARVARYDERLAIVVADLDDLKGINDRHGHAVGSEVIRSIGLALAEEARAADTVVRYGGDEFVVLLPHAGADEARRFAERALARIRALRPHGLSVSASLGVADRRSDDTDLDQVMRRADDACYRAKSRGAGRGAVATA